MPATIAIINGPNLNLLGTREPEKYGYETLMDVETRLYDLAGGLGVQLMTFQSNSEGALMDHIHELRGQVKAIVINAGAYTHTSIALRDALVGASVPFFEVHISNVYAREEFRHHSYLSAAAVGVICGFGTSGYDYALREAARRFCK